MFTDTPKLQPISTSKKVPSNAGNPNNNNNNSGNNNASNTPNACSSKQDFLSARYSYGSYRGKNYQNSEKNNKSREFNEYYKKSSVQSNKFNNTYKRWPDWSNTTNNSTNYNQRSLNHINNNQYRKNYKYSESAYKGRESSFAEDSFQYNSFNNEIDQVKNKRKYTNSHTESLSNRNDKIKRLQFKQDKNKTKTNFRQHTKNNNSFHAKRTKYSKSIDVTETSVNTVEKDNENNCDTDKTKTVLTATDNNFREGIQELASKSPTFKEDTLEAPSINGITVNANTPLEQQPENVLNGRAENILYATNLAAAAASCDATLQFDEPKLEIRNKETEALHTLLENITPALLQDTATLSPQTVHTAVISESEPSDFHIPKISLIPISRLIAAEFWEPTSSDNLINENSVKPSSAAPKNLYKPNLIQRKRNVSTCSTSSTSSQTNSTTDRIVEKLVTMNKINIKNIINSSETKYDEALKTQARKRLREEIRRQLKTMNIGPPKDPISTDFIPDEIVDSIDIPDVVFDEIRKALGLELFSFSKDDNMKSVEDIVTCVSAEDTGSATVENTNTAAAVLATTAIELSTSLPLTQSTTPRVKYEIKTENMFANKYSDDRTNTLEGRKKLKKFKKRKESRKSKSHRSLKKLQEDVVVLISSSSSSESSSSSSASSTSSSSSSASSSSDSESGVSEKSSTSSAKRKRLKLKVDAENVVDSFEKLILSSLSENLRDRYRSKYSTSINTKLHFISCICTSDYNSGKFSKLQIAKVQKNLKSSDCSMALEFLMKEIVNVFNKQKQVAKMEDSNKTSRRLEHAPKTGAAKEAINENLAKEKSSSNSKTISKSSDTVKTKCVNAAEKLKLAATNNEQHIQECVSKVLSLYRQEMKAAMQANETKNQPSCTQALSATAENDATKLQQQQKTAVNPLSSNNLDKNAGNAKQTEDEAPLQNPTNCINQQQRQQQQQQHQTAQQQSTCLTINGDSEKNQQATACPMTKVQQCVDTAEEKISTHIIPIHSFCSSDYSGDVSTTLNGNLNSTLLSISSRNFNQQPPFPIVDLEELKKQSPIGEVVVNNLREIDVKLMELHKRKMYLEEMILKLQKDKMEADLLTIKLQNEKFILLNTAMTANVTSTAMKNHNSNIENIASSLKQHESFSAFKNVKIEATSCCTGKSNVVIEKEREEESRKKCTKTPAISNSRHTAKETTDNVTKRKQPSTAAANEIMKKRCKSSKPTTASKSCSQKKPSQRSTKAKASKSTELASETSSKCTAPITSAAPPIENVAKATTDCSSLHSATPAPSMGPPETPAVLPPHSPQTAEVNNTPQVDDKTKSLYRDMPTGNFETVRNPITQIRIFEEFIIASSEDGKIYKFEVATLKLLAQFAKHSEAITQMYLHPEKKLIYTTSLDGYLKKTSIENFALDIQSVYLQEPLQSIDMQWDIAYIGSRWGNIYTYNIATNCLAEKPLCSTDSSIISIKATKEGIRKTLIVSSKGNLIHLRDANSGLLLRTFDVPESINIYSILLNEGIVYCGTQKKEIRKYDFVSGQCLGLMTCGNGAVSMQMYNNKYIFIGCYDGYIYILDKATGKQVGRLAGSGKMILTLEIIEDKIITSAKDNTMKVADIPSYCLKNNAH